jgi:peptide/nickel transport system substrate-binding protein
VLSAFADNLVLLPAHVFDLTDPDHPRHDVDASTEARAREINENPANTQWIGLGPYRLTSFSQQAVEAERFPGFFDPEQGGYVDRIRWRHIPGDDAAFQALLNGELDFSVRISSDQYFGAATEAPAFRERFCKGYFYLGSFNYVPWNLRRPLFQDLRVRKALAQACDLETFVRTVAHGLAELPTGPQCFFGPAYNRDVQRLPFDLERAQELLAEAGWYDRDGDGLIDKDGRPFEFEMLIQAGNKGSELFAQQYQETLARAGIRMSVTGLEWAAYIKRIYDRDFDCGQMAWAVDVTENDPIQLWHSSGAAPGVRGSNHAGVADAYVDELIARGDRELDDEARWKIWKELHRYLYEEVQPYLYRELPPRKFALDKRLRGVQFFLINPGYSPRRWFYPLGTPGTREQR